MFGAEGLYAYRVRGKGLPAHQIAKGDILVLSRPGDRWRRVVVELNGVLGMYHCRVQKGVTQLAELDGPAVEIEAGVRVLGVLEGVIRVV